MRLKPEDGQKSIYTKQMFQDLNPDTDTFIAALKYEFDT